MKKAGRFGDEENRQQYFYLWHMKTCTQTSVSHLKLVPMIGTVEAQSNHRNQNIMYIYVYTHIRMIVDRFSSFLFRPVVELLAHGRYMLSSVEFL